MVKRSHELEITFSLAYRTVLFDSTCTKLDLSYAFLFECTQNRALRKVYYNSTFRYKCAKRVIRARVWFIARANESDKNIRATIPLHLHVSNLIFFNRVCETRRTMIIPISLRSSNNHTTTTRKYKGSSTTSRSERTPSARLWKSPKEIGSRAYFAHSPTRSVHEVNGSAHARLV